jgi:hypothetical protein
MIIDIKEYGKKPNIAGFSWGEPYVEIPKRWLDFLVTEFEKKNDALIHINEYWNRDQNESAMANALWEIITVSEEAITLVTEELKDTDSTESTQAE